MEIDEQGFELLDAAQCTEVLRSAVSGRIALTDHALPLIVPVGFVSTGSDLIFGVGSAALARAAAARHVVCFEADSSDEWSPEERPSLAWSVSMIGQLQEDDGLHPCVADMIRLTPWSRGTTSFARLVPEIVIGRRLIRG